MCGMQITQSWSSATGWEYYTMGEGTSCYYMTSKATLQDAGNGEKYLFYGFWFQNYVFFANLEPK